MRQVDILEDGQLLLVLSGRQVLTSIASLFKVGFCLERVIKDGIFQLSTTVKVFESINQELRIFREFYIPLDVTSVNYLNTRLCIGRPTGFEVIGVTREAGSAGPAC
ncbi:hypothetical protein B0H14DRAFT_3722430 [Mycena olivaceomarginata]|nr:hypothetical protein B0H14DRAFT_3722430 [Mycena olivaceomarginata]